MPERKFKVVHGLQPGFHSGKLDFKLKYSFSGATHRLIHSELQCGPQ